VRLAPARIQPPLPPPRSALPPSCRHAHSRSISTTESPAFVWCSGGDAKEVVVGEAVPTLVVPSPIRSKWEVHRWRWWVGWAKLEAAVRADVDLRVVAAAGLYEAWVLARGWAAYGRSGICCRTCTRQPGRTCTPASRSLKSQG
jgi:hypothetical protein